MDDEAHLHEMVRIYTHRLKLCEQKIATFGIHCPDHILIEAHNIKTKLQQLIAGADTPDQTLSPQEVASIGTMLDALDTDLTVTKVKTFKVLGCAFASVTETLTIMLILGVFLMVALNSGRHVNVRISGIGSSLTDGRPTGTPPSAPPSPDTPFSQQRFFLHTEARTAPATCVVIHLRDANQRGWVFSVLGREEQSTFDSMGTATLCGLDPDQAYWGTIRDAIGTTIIGGSDIPLSPGDTVWGEWR